MKKLSLLAALTLTVAYAHAQSQQWSTEPLQVIPGVTANIGTANDKPLNFIINNAEKMVLDTDGKLKVNGLAGIGERILLVDANGKMRAADGGGNSSPCDRGAMPWYEGGNTVYFAGRNSAGSCNAVDFLLKANNTPLIFLKTNKFVGIGANNSNPTAQLDVSDGTSFSGNSADGLAHTKLSGTSNGVIETTDDMNLAFGAANNFFIGAGAYGSGFTPKISLVNGNVGIGTGYTTLSSKLTVNATTQSNYTGMSVIVNNTTTDAFDVFNSATNRAEFRVKANGVVYSREVNVQLTAFPDYVFNGNYQLRSLESLESYISKNHHLPNVPSAAEVEKNGANLGELAKIQLEKIEELTLYVIQLKKELDELKKDKK
jgi:hypothetical protein